MGHEWFMRQALEEAEEALREGEIPIGAVVVHHGEVIARAHNRREQARDATAHAEVLAIRLAGERLGGWRLNGAVMYVTVEPCPMCAGALLQARVERVVYGAREPKTGAVISAVELLQDPRFNHRVEVVPGVLEAPCRELLQRFFAERR